jgi:hypothetical protein
MARPRNVLLVPPWADKVVASMDEMSLHDSSKTSMLMILLRDICDPGIFCDDATPFIQHFKINNTFQHDTFVLVAASLLQWCEEQRNIHGLSLGYSIQYNKIKPVRFCRRGGGGGGGRRDAPPHFEIPWKKIKKFEKSQF